MIHDHCKYITIPEFNEFSCSIFDTKLKQVNIATKSDANAVSQHAINNKEKKEKLQVFTLRYFFGRIFLVMMIFKICFVNQQTFSTIDVKEENNEKKVSDCKLIKL